MNFIQSPGTKSGNENGNEFYGFKLSGNCDAAVFPLLVGIEVQFLLIAIVCALVVHAIKQSGAEKCFVVLESLALPDNKDIVLRDLFVIGLVQVLICVISHCLFAEFYKFLFIHSDITSILHP